MYQKVTIIGNVGRDPELRHAPDGTPVTDISVATNRRWTNADGSKGQETIWWRVTAWRGLANVVVDYIGTGDLVYVEGRMTPDKETGRPRIWMTREGEPRASYEVTANMIRNMGKRSMDDSSSRRSGGDYQEERPAEPEIGSEEDSIPF